MFFVDYSVTYNINAFLGALRVPDMIRIYVNRDCGETRLDWSRYASPDSYYTQRSRRSLLSETLSRCRRLSKSRGNAVATMSY
jgi:hypothetical protein